MSKVAQCEYSRLYNGEPIDYDSYKDQLAIVISDSDTNESEASFLFSQKYLESRGKNVTQENMERDIKGNPKLIGGCLTKVSSPTCTELPMLLLTTSRTL